jgi:hypothetical protein
MYEKLHDIKEIERVVNGVMRIFNSSKTVLKNCGFIGKLQIHSYNGGMFFGGGGSIKLNLQNTHLDVNNLLYGCILYISCSENNKKKEDIDYIYSSVLRGVEYLYRIHKQLETNKISLNETKLSLLERDILLEELSVSANVKMVVDAIDKKIELNRYGSYEIQNVGFVGKLKIIIATKNIWDGGNSSKLNDGNIRLNSDGYVEGAVICIVKSRLVNNEEELKKEIEYVNASIWHEVEHLFQNFLKLKNDRLTITSNDSTSKEYRKKDFLNNLGSKNVNNENEYIELLSWMFYMDEREQDASASELYNISMRVDFSFHKDLMDFYRNSATYNKLQTLKEFKEMLECVDQDNENYLEMVEWFNTQNFNKNYLDDENEKKDDSDDEPKNYLIFDLQKTLNLLNYYIKRYESKIGKVLTKIKKDKKIIYQESVNLNERTRRLLHLIKKLESLNEGYLMVHEPRLRVNIMPRVKRTK